MFAFNGEYLEEYANFLEKKRKNSDIFYKFFDYGEMEIKKHYLREIRTMLKKQYSQLPDSTNVPKYTFSKKDWDTIDQMIDTDDANVQDMLLFFTVATNQSMYEWLCNGDVGNNHKSYVHDVKAFEIFVKSELRPTCTSFMDGRSNADLDSTVRRLRFKYFEMCAFPIDAINWRREFADMKKKQQENALSIPTRTDYNKWNRYSDI